VDTTRLTTLHLKKRDLGCSNVVVLSLDLENTEIRAEMEATNLSALEIEKQCESQRKANMKLEAGTSERGT
jgi:hypothetical protein